jgi:heme/copper-type cytochrome/quinol oxidase subunit 4
MGQRGLFFQILTLLKGAAFFFAIVMVVFTGVKVIAAADADKSKKIMSGVLNVVAALAIMQVVDLIYYMASAENFAEQAMEFIFTVARIFGYIYGSIAVLMVFYAGYSLLTDAGGGDGFKRAKNILINLLVSGLVLFGFLLILYQVFAEFV